jgi:hypothetical protein
MIINVGFSFSLFWLQVGYSSPAESGIEDDLGLNTAEVQFN